jgi:hypothetical protein
LTPEALEHTDQAFPGERAFFFMSVAAAVEADTTTAVTDQLVLAHTLEIGDSLIREAAPAGIAVAAKAGQHHAQAGEPQESGTGFAGGRSLAFSVRFLRRLSCRSPVNKRIPWPSVWSIFL